MLKTLPARPIAASYSAFRAPVASPSSIRRRFGTGPFCPFHGFKLHSWCRTAISVRPNKCPPRGWTKGALAVGRSDDVGYEAEGQGPSDEEATNGRTDHAATGSRVAGVLNAAEEAAEMIKDEARRQADEVLRQATADAATRVED